MDNITVCRNHDTTGVVECHQNLPGRGGGRGLTKQKALKPSSVANFVISELLMFFVQFE